jgi:SPOR domain
VLYHKVYAGMLQDTAQAAELRARLLSGGQVDSAAVGGPSALIQERPLAFDLGDFATREAAQARADSLAARAIPAYAVPVPLSDGREAWKLYGGAFADSAGAAPMRTMLQSAGLPARLVPRSGRAPATSK